MYMGGMLGLECIYAWSIAAISSEDPQHRMVEWFMSHELERNWPWQYQLLRGQWPEETQVLEASTKKVIVEIHFMPILCSVQCDIQTSTAYEEQWLESQASLVATDLQIFHRMETNLGLGRTSKNYTFFVQSAKYTPIGKVRWVLLPYVCE